MGNYGSPAVRPDPPTDPPPMTDENTVLVVDDEPDIVDMFALWLKGDFTVLTATGGEEALEKLDDSVDVVLLDRRMPRFSGDEVLKEIRDRAYQCRVVLVTAVEPDIDIIDMGFDDYLVKPVTKDELVDIIESMLKRSSYDAQTREYFALASKVAALDSSLSEAERESSDEYADLKERLEEAEKEASATRDDLVDADDFEAAFRDLNR